MPIRRRAEDKPELPAPEIVCLLVQGHFHPCKDKPEDREPYLVDLPQYWAECKDVLLPLCIFGPEEQLLAATIMRSWGPMMAVGSPGPGRRPWAWWVYSAPEPRRKIADGSQPRPAADAELMLEPFWRIIPPPARRDFHWFEGEPAYLDRLNLWLPGEQELLT